MKHIGTERIETERLILRRLEVSDAPAMFNNWANDDEVAKYMRWDTHKNVEVTQSYLEMCLSEYENLNYYHWGICLKSGELIGSIGALGVSDIDEKAEAGYCIGRAFWGNGYVPEALKAVIHFMMIDVGLNRIEAYHSVNNPASGRVMEKAGMEFEGIAKKKYRCRLGFQDSGSYGIVKDELYKQPLVGDFLEVPKLSNDEIELVCTEKTPGNPEIKYVPQYVFSIMKNGQAIGNINFRIGFTDGLYYGGNIGYNIDEEHRGHGYAEKACRLLLPLIKAHGMDKVLITNDKDNLPSKRTCEKLGARFIRVARLPEWTELYAMGRRYSNIFEWDVNSAISENNF